MTNIVWTIVSVVVALGVFHLLQGILPTYTAVFAACVVANVFGYGEGLLEMR